MSNLALTLTCPVCGFPVPPATPEGLCPACLAAALVDAPDAPRSSPELSPGEDLEGLRYFGDYELLEEINRGGMGIVYKARQLGVNRVVALKVLIGGAAAGQDFVHRFHTEAAAAARLDHPHIVPVYEFGTHEGAHFLTMRFMEGGTLLERLKSGVVVPREAARLMILIAGAVQQAHQRGVLHRDLKPGNILLDADGHPCVADFGLARLFDDDDSLTLSHAVVGTAGYLPPEIVRGGSPQATIASDVYGLGAILYELLSGRPPFTGASIPEILRKVQEEEPRLPKSEVKGQKSERGRGIPDLRFAICDLETICLKCLEKDPGRRYATAQDLADELQRFLNDEPILARPIGAAERLWRWCRRRPAIAGLSVGLVLALLGGFAGTLWQLNEARRNDTEKRLHLARLHELNGVSLMQEGDLFRSLLWFAEAIELDPAPPQAKALQEIRMASIIAQSPQLVAVITHDSEPVADAAFSPARDQLATVGRDRRLRLWNIPTGNPLLVTDPFDELPSSVQFAPDGAALILTSSAFNHAWLISLEAEPSPSGLEGRATASPTLKVPAPVDEINDAGRAAHPAGSPPLQYSLRGSSPHLSAGANNLPLAPTFDSTGDRFLTQCAPQTLQVWNRHDATPLGPAILLDAPIAWMRFTDDANAIRVITRDRRVSAWDWRTGLEETNRTSNIELPTSNVEVPSQFGVGRSTVDLQRSPAAPQTPSSELRTPPSPLHSSFETRRSKSASPTGHYLATLHPSYAVFVWDVEPRIEPSVLLRPGAPRNLVETGRDGSVSAVRDPNSTIRVRGTTAASEVSLHPSSVKESPVQAWFDQTSQFLILEYTGQRAQIWDPASGLPITPVFHSRYATNEAEYRAVNLPKSSIPNPQSTIPNRPPPSAFGLPPSDLRLQAELLAGSRLDGTGGWKPLNLGEIVERWNELRGKIPTLGNRQDQ